MLSTLANTITEYKILLYSPRYLFFCKRFLYLHFHPHYDHYHDYYVQFQLGENNFNKTALIKSVFR